MQKRVLKNMLLVLGAAVVCCTALCAVLFRLRGVQLAILLGAGLVSFLAAALLARALSAACTAPLHEFLGALEAHRTSGGAPARPEETEPELAALYEEFRLLSLRADTLSGRLRQERERIRAMMNALPTGVLIVDRERRARIVNDTALKALSTTRAALIGKTLSHVPNAARLCEGLARAAVSRYAVTVEIPLPDARSGEASIMRAPCAPPSEEAFFLILIEDRTVQHEAEAVRKRFFTDASQLLRTPTERIRGYAELLCSDTPLNGNKVEDVSLRILTEARHLRATVSKLLLLTRLENNDLTPMREPLDLVPLFTERCKRAEKAAAACGVTLTSEAQPCTLFASRFEIAELLDELLDNAVRYNREGGSVQAALSVENGSPCIRIWSAGETIPPEKARHLFERFYRIGNSVGAGLGLCIVRQIALGLGGAVLLTPTRGGNLFTVRFPVQQAAE